MRFGGVSHGLVGVSLPFSFPYLCFPTIPHLENSLSLVG